MKKLNPTLLVLTLLFFKFFFVFGQQTILSEQKAEEYFSQAAEFYKNNAYERAIDYCTKAIQLNINHADSYWYRGSSFYELKKYEEAIQDFEKVVELAPQFPSAYGSIGWNLILLGRFDEAITPINKSIELDSTLYYNFLNKGHVYLMKGNIETAKHYYKKALYNIETKEDFNEGPIADFEIFIKNGWKPEDCGNMKRWMINQFDNRNHYYALADEQLNNAVVTFMANEYNRCIEFSKKTIESENSSLYPRYIKNWSANFFMATSYERLEDYSNAMHYYQKTYQLMDPLVYSSDLVNVLRSIGKIHMYNREYDKAIENFDKAVNILNIIIDEYKSTADWEEMSNYYFSLYNILDQEGEIYSRKNAPELAIDTYKKSLNIARKLEDKDQILQTLNKIGDEYSKLGQNSKALEYYREASTIRR